MTWKICFSSGGFTSLMGRALVVHVMVHPKLNYLMQCMQFYSDAIEEINKAVLSFLWEGKRHIPKVGLAVLEAPLQYGGIGLKPLDLRAITSRFRYIKRFFVREGDNWMMEKSPVESIIHYFLDLAVRSLAPHLPREKMVPLILAAKYYKPGPIQFIGHVPKIFYVIYWDIERAIKIMGSADYLENYSHFGYLEKLMERRTLSLRQGSVHKAFISRFMFPQQVESGLWTNITLKLLEPKLKSFAFKLAHDCLPTKHGMWRIMRHFQGSQYDPFCNYCKHVMLRNVHCTAEHIFRHCPVAQGAWRFVNHNLRAEGEESFNVDNRLVFFGME